EREAATLRNVETVLDAPDADLHWYGKDDVYPLRKMGHLTVTDRDVTDEVDPDALLSRAQELRDELTFRDA
ncbi:5-(carboxyamino)imidazole ribonucleotide synthase, partial [Halorubrum sp. SP3]